MLPVNPQIESEISRQNKHWNGEFFKVPEAFYRHKYAEIANSLANQQITAITGMRRTGKTVIMKQLVNNLIKSGTEANHILFFTFDEALAKNEKILEYIVEYHLERAKTYGSGKYYIFIDEIQYVPMWQHILKRYYDTEPNVKFVISGSSSLFVKKKSTESLAGRINEYYMGILSFTEYLELTQCAGVSVLKEYKQNLFNLKNSLTANPKQRYFVNQHGNELQRHFETYIKYGQFPEIALKTVITEINSYLLNDIYKKTIEYDIPNLYKIEKPFELSSLFQILINETGSLIELQRLSADVAVQQKTLNNYLGWLEKSYLISSIYNYTKSFRKSPKLARKIYMASTNFFSPFHEFTNTEVNNIYMGMLAENYAYILIKNTFLYCSFYRKKGQEVDFVATNDLLNNQSYRLFECKYVNDPTNYKYKLLRRLANKFACRYIVFTKNLLMEDGENGLFVPLWLVTT